MSLRQVTLKRDVEFHSKTWKAGMILIVLQEWESATGPQVKLGDPRSGKELITEINADAVAEVSYATAD